MWFRLVGCKEVLLYLLLVQVVYLEITTSPYWGTGTVSTRSLWLNVLLLYLPRGIKRALLLLLSVSWFFGNCRETIWILFLQFSHTICLMLVTSVLLTLHAQCGLWILASTTLRSDYCASWVMTTNAHLTQNMWPIILFMTNSWQIYCWEFYCVNVDYIFIPCW